MWDIKKRIFSLVLQFHKKLLFLDAKIEGNNNIKPLKKLVLSNKAFSICHLVQIIFSKKNLKKYNTHFKTQSKLNDT